jgi:hypothetical protein
VRPCELQTLLYVQLINQSEKIKVMVGEAFIEFYSRWLAVRTSCMHAWISFSAARAPALHGNACQSHMHFTNIYMYVHGLVIQSCIYMHTSLIYAYTYKRRCSQSASKLHGFYLCTSMHFNLEYTDTYTHKHAYTYIHTRLKYMHQVPRIELLGTCVCVCVCVCMCV